MEDIGPTILSYINCGSDYKSCTLVSHQWRRWSQLAHPAADTLFANHLVTLLKMFPDEKWNIYHLSKNPNITADFVREHINWDWSWNRIISNFTLFLDDILSILRPEPIIKIVAHPGFSYVVAEYEISDEVYWRTLSYNPSLTWDYILQHRDKPWKWSVLSRHPAFNWQNICNHPELPWKYEHVARNPNVIPRQFAEVITDLNLLAHLSRNPNITWEFVLARPEILWCWEQLIMFLPVNTELLTAHADMEELCNIDTCDILRLNPSVVVSTLHEFKKLEWDWQGLLNNMNITWKDILSVMSEHDDYEWECISQNPNLTWRIIADNLHYPWYWKHISKNTFGKKALPYV